MRIALIGPRWRIAPKALNPKLKPYLIPIKTALKPYPIFLQLLLKKCVLDNAPDEQIDALNTDLHDLQELLVVYLKSIEISDIIAKGDQNVYWKRRRA